ncbi:MAG: hypothetical protein Q4P24_18385, partial [Rhodobacterales bacterium]|nr:hypothetical protein [Rhodobacterales bacterium]
MIVALSELVEALNRTTKMKRAPAGARSTGLKEGAFVPELTGFRVEMPGGSSLVNIKSGKLETDVVFEVRRMAPIAKVLSTHLPKEEEVTILVSETELAFKCGSSRLGSVMKSVYLAQPMPVSD